MSPQTNENSTVYIKINKTDESRWIRANPGSRQHVLSMWGMAVVVLSFEHVDWCAPESINIHCIHPVSLLIPKIFENDTIWKHCEYPSLTYSTLDFVNLLVFSWQNISHVHPFPKQKNYPGCCKSHLRRPFCPACVRLWEVGVKQTPYANNHSGVACGHLPEQQNGTEIIVKSGARRPVIWFSKDTSCSCSCSCRSCSCRSCSCRSCSCRSCSYSSSSYYYYYNYNYYYNREAPNNARKSLTYIYIYMHT